MAEILSTNNFVATIDDIDLPFVMQYKWYGARKKTDNTMYFVTKNKLSLHRLIMNAPNDKQVDHIDGNGLNNTRSNLRICTFTENRRNRKKFKCRTSKYKGVCKKKAKKYQYDKWYAYIWINGKSVHLGWYDKEEDAAVAYNKAAIENFGEYAGLNNVTY